MSETLILLLGQSPADPVRWALVGADGVSAADVTASAFDLVGVASHAEHARAVVAVLPGELVAMRTMASPPQVASKFRAAARYLLEDELGEGLDTLHVAVARRQGGVGAALAVKSIIMDEWLGIFAQAGFSPDIITADFALLPAAQDTAIIVFEPVRLTAVIGFDGFAAERPMADALAVQLAGRDDIQSICALGEPDTERFEVEGKAIDWRDAENNISLFHLYAEGAARGDAPNLLQGAYRKHRDWRGAAKVWRRASILAAACLVGLVGVVIADSARSLRLADQLNRDALAMHQEAFPGQANIDPRDNARRILSSQSPRLAFLPLSTQFAESLEDTDNVQIERIRYNAARGEFSVNLRFNDINDLEALKRALIERGVDAAEAGGVRRSGGQYVSELQVNAL